MSTSVVSLPGLYWLLAEQWHNRLLHLGNMYFGMTGN